MAYLINGLPVEVLGWMRSDRVMRGPCPPVELDAAGRTPAQVRQGVHFAKPDTWGGPDAATTAGHRPLRHRADHSLGPHPSLPHDSRGMDRP